MRLIGMVEEGIYKDDCDGMTAEEIQEHYGVDRPDIVQTRNKTGAGHYDSSSEEDDSDEEEDNNDVDPEKVSVQVEPTTSPFRNDTHQTIFEELFKQATDDGIVSQGYAVLPEEWEDEEYPSAELLQVGKKSSGETVIYLPVHIWLPRAQMWANTLALTSHVLHTLGEE